MKHISNCNLARLCCIVALACVSYQKVEAQCGMVIPLEARWQLVSLPRGAGQSLTPPPGCVDPVDPALRWIFRGCCGDQCNIEQVRHYDATTNEWLIYAPPPFPPELNTLTTIDAATGFWIKLKQPVQLLVGMSRAAALTQPTLEFNAGWNLIGTGSHTRQTWDMVFGRDSTGSVAQPVNSVWQFDSAGTTYFGLDLTSNPPTGSTEWLESNRGIWVHTSAPFTMAPAVATTLAAATSSGGGIAALSEPFLYGEHSFESAGFDIDRVPIGCYGPEDTDAWNDFGVPANDKDGNFGPNGFHDPPVTGRIKMLVNIGSPLAVPSLQPGDPGYVPPENWQVITGGLAIFRAAHRPGTP